MTIVINGSGTVTGISVGGLPDGIVDTDMIAAGAVTAAKRGAGAILQVVQGTSQSHLSSTSTTYVNLTGVTADITPSSSSNKILIICSLAIGKENNNSFLGKVLRNGTAIAGGERHSGHSSQEQDVWFNIRTTDYSTNASTAIYLDSPSSTSSLTYAVQGKTTGSGNSFTLNRTRQNNDTAYDSPTFSSIILMEVAG